MPHRKDFRAVNVIGPSISYIPLPCGRYALVDDDMAIYLQEWRWRSKRDEKNGRYYCRREGIHGTSMLHTLLLRKRPGFVPDHINGNGLDNRLANLRYATASQNSCNRRKRANNKSGFKGVSWNKRAQKWCAQIMVQGQQKHLGLFTEVTAAADAYRQAAFALHGPFANLG